MTAGGSLIALITASVLERLGWLNASAGAGPLRRLVGASIGDALFQLGLLGLILAGLDCLWCFVACRRGWRFRSPYPLLVPLVVALLVGFSTGEAALRLLYREGLSFTHHAGPLVRRFERDFEFNPYDGPSRGPAVSGP